MDSKTKVSMGKKYVKIVQENGVFAFIVKEDFKHFKKFGSGKFELTARQGAMQTSGLKI